MSDIDLDQSHSQGALPAALRRLARAAPASAPPELGTGLAKAFRRHHFRRRIVRSSAVCAILLGVGAALLLIATNDRTRRGISRAERQPAAAPPANVSASVSREASTRDGVDQTIQPHRVAGHGGRARQVRAEARSTAARSDSAPILSSAGQEKFVPLPSFAFRVPGEELRIIRVSMPVSSLRLLGVQVHGEFSSRRITTDLVIGADGTPYAFRPVT